MKLIPKIKWQPNKINLNLIKICKQVKYLLNNQTLLKINKSNKLTKMIKSKQNLKCNQLMNNQYSNKLNN
jgi:uncharacterized membrane protein